MKVGMQVEDTWEQSKVSVLNCSRGRPDRNLSKSIFITTTYTNKDFKLLKAKTNISNRESETQEKHWNPSKKCFNWSIKASTEKGSLWLYEDYR